MPPTPFQARARTAFDAAARPSGIVLLWSEEQGNMYAGEVMLVARSHDAFVTIWIYDDSVDYQLSSSEVFNFEAQSFANERSLLSAAIVHFEQHVVART